MGEIKKGLARKVIERDSQLCQLCGAQGNDIHHIIYKSHGGLDKEENLILLCRTCHAKAHSSDRVYREVLLGKQCERYDVDVNKLKGRNKWIKSR